GADCLVGPELPRALDRVCVEDDRRAEADNGEHEMDAPLVPAGYAFHRVVVRRPGARISRDRSSGAVPPKLCQRPREISGSFSPHLPTRRYCIAAPNVL